MTSTTQRPRASGVGPRQVLLRSLFAIALLVPVGTLFQAVWRLDSARVDAASQERDGIDYLTALGPLTNALVGAESAVVARAPAPKDAVTQAIRGVDAVDARVGAGLTTTERWSDLREKIQALVGGAPGDRVRAYEAYADVTDLLLALYAKVSDSSHLAQDADADASFLQDAVGRQLPATIIRLGRLADIAALAPARPAADAVETAAGLLAGRDAVIEASDALTEDFLLAVAVTDSRTLSKTMLADINAFRLVTDRLEASTAIVDGDVTAADAAEVGGLRANGITAGTALTEAVVSELDRINAARHDTAVFDRNVALAAGGLGVLLALTPLALGLVGWRRSTRRRSADELPDADPGAANVPAWSTDHRELLPVGGRERSGATR